MTLVIQCRQVLNAVVDGTPPKAEVNTNFVTSLVLMTGTTGEGQPSLQTVNIVIGPFHNDGVQPKARKLVCVHLEPKTSPKGNVREGFGLVHGCIKAL
jgi:hypothetical protein